MEKEYDYNQFVKECAQVCIGWANCSYADDNPGSCPLLNGYVGAGDRETAYMERGDFPWTF